MKRLWMAAVLAIAMAIAVSGAAGAAAPLSGAGVLLQYCAGTGAEEHPASAEVLQMVANDELATFGGTRFTLVYEPLLAPERAGKVVARIRVDRAAGGREKVGKLVARQNPGGDAQTEQVFPLALRRGDVVIWRLQFRNFSLMGAGGCSLVIGATLVP